MSESELKEKDYKEMTVGMKTFKSFLRKFPGGIKDVIDLSKEKAKNQIADNIAGMFSEMRNTVQGVLNKLQGDLGLVQSINKLENKIIEFINAFSRFIAKFLRLIGDPNKLGLALKNLLLWMELLGNPFNFGRIGWSWGLLMPPGIPQPGDITIIPKE